MNWRKVNGAIAGVLCLFFLVHGILGILWTSGAINAELAFVIWAFFIAALVHGLLSIVTSRQMLHDAERPPSRRKKRHLVLKWVTGLALLLIACVHALLPEHAAAWPSVSILVALALAVHMYVGGKSLTSDLGLPRGMCIAFRLVAIAWAGIVCIGLLT
ncbi:MAG TPA: hypothetical protein OIM11_00225 [Coriobacteriaceae bacterium]|nr:hypothetical protein [Coriobacteriaceae bacterium]